MKNRTVRLCFISLAGIPLIGFSGCCCPCNTRAQLLEDFWVGPEEQIQWLQQQRAASSSSEEEWNSTHSHWDSSGAAYSPRN